jgi:asparagine N-glycosylation enzyme membrane subunit Stt3
LETVLGLGLGMLLLIAIGWLLPILLILRSNKTTGLEKLLWIVLIFFFSWFSWILYLIIAPVDKRKEQA